jgi:hypothetical protein
MRARPYSAPVRDARTGESATRARRTNSPRCTRNSARSAQCAAGSTPRASSSTPICTPCSPKANARLQNRQSAQGFELGAARPKIILVDPLEPSRSNRHFTQIPTGAQAADGRLDAYRKARFGPGFSGRGNRPRVSFGLRNLFSREIDHENHGYNPYLLSRLGFPTKITIPFAAEPCPKHSRMHMFRMLR